MIRIVQRKDSTCDVLQYRPGLIPGFLTAALPESSSQGTSIDLQSALTLLLMSIFVLATAA